MHYASFLREHYILNMECLPEHFYNKYIFISNLSGAINNNASLIVRGVCENMNNS